MRAVKLGKLPVDVSDLDLYHENPNWFILNRLDTVNMLTPLGENLVMLHRHHPSAAPVPFTLVNTSTRDRVLIYPDYTYPVTHRGDTWAVEAWDEVIPRYRILDVLKDENGRGFIYKVVDIYSEARYHFSEIELLKHVLYSRSYESEISDLF